MNNISQNVTKVKEAAKDVAIGAAVLAPVVGFMYLLTALIDNNYISRDTVADVFLVLVSVAACWTVGGCVQAVRRWQNYQREEQERKTQKAFEKLGNVGNE